MIVREQILNDYKAIKKKAEKYFKNNRFEKCLSTIEAAAFLAYNFNLFYCDDDFDKIIFKIGEKYTKELQSDKKIRDQKIVFYDSFGFDNRGLTQQYIRALISYDLPFSYILGSDASLHMSITILEELNAYDKAEIFIISDKLSKLEKISHLSKLIDGLLPSKIFTHKTPWDTVGNAVFSNVKFAEKFHINLTDHAFWLGKNAADYFIEFRSYGANISVAERKINISKLLLLPYYPIVSDICFQGFPITIKRDAVVLFTGSSYYKMYGEKGKFFSLIKHILNENPKTILLIAGNGYAKPLNDFMSKNDFQERIFLLGDRKDINKVFEHIDIYIATYPITGGLMGQYAALNRKPVVAFTEPNLLCNVLEEFVSTNNHQLTHFTEESFHKEIKSLVEDKVYRSYVSDKIGDSIVTPDMFNENFYSVVFKKNVIKPFEIYNIDVDRFAEVYLEAENNYLHSYGSIIFRYFKAAGIEIEFKYYPSIIKYIAEKVSKKLFNN